jgi:hypothetical protein
MELGHTLSTASYRFSRELHEKLAEIEPNLKGKHQILYGAFLHKKVQSDEL